MLNSSSSPTAVNKKPARKKNWLRWLIAAVLVYILAGILMFFFQERLIFHPQPISKAAIRHIERNHPEAQAISIVMKDCTEVKGWLVRGSANAGSLCIYFGGNGDEASNMIDQAGRYPDWSFALVNYRGYGESDGSPNEKKLCSDALQIYDYFSTRQEVESAPIVVMGRSIGSGVAVYLAENRAVDGVILTTPFDSVLNVAQEKLPIYPIRFMLRNRFDSLARAGSIEQPVLIITAAKDKLIPPGHARKLADRWSGKVFMQEIPGKDHDSVVTSDQYWQSISDYLDRF